MNDFTSEEELQKIIIDLQDKVDDLRWRMNSVCNFLSRNFPEKMDCITQLYMVEEKSRKEHDIDKLKNILAFLTILFGEKAADLLLEMSPEYIFEKWDRYTQSSRDDEWKWGLHPNLK